MEQKIKEFVEKRIEREKEKIINSGESSARSFIAQEEEKINEKEKIEKLKVEAQLKIERAKQLNEAKNAVLKEILGFREVIFEQLVKEFFSYVEKIKGKKEYEKIYRALVEEAKANFFYKEGVLVVPEGEKKWVKEILTNELLNSFSISESSLIKYGVILESMDGKFRIYNTFETRLERAKPMIMEKLKEIFEV